MNKTNSSSTTQPGLAQRVAARVARLYVFNFWHAVWLAADMQHQTAPHPRNECSVFAYTRTSCDHCY